jgi:sigma-B regulation protein RsbU (phosphoserine phosphatase)
MPGAVAMLVVIRANDADFRAGSDPRAQPWRLGDGLHILAPTRATGDFRGDHVHTLGGSPGADPGDRESGTAPAVEAARLAAVARYDILDTPPDGSFDRVAALAARWMSTPIATVTIVDEDRIWFKATHGLNGVTQINREPGLCASAIMQDGPYTVEDTLTDPRTSHNSLIQSAAGIRFYAAAPITTSDGHRLGTVNVLDTRPRQVSAADLDTLTDLADLVMDALELRLSALRVLRAERAMREQAERAEGTIATFASTLQRTLLPPALPDIPGLEMACHYYPASARHVGGDFYDVFPLSDGRWAFFLGDVCGHGAEAAALTSLVRYTLRAAAWHDPEPISVLSQLNATLLAEPRESQGLATVMFGVMAPGHGGGLHVVLGAGGHEPALWLRPGPDGTSTVTQVWPEGGMLVGAIRDARFALSELHLAPGDALVLYTDGLTEFPETGSGFRDDDLPTFLAQLGHRTPTALVSDLVDEVSTFDPPPTDDVALLVIGPLPPSTPPDRAGIGPWTTAG